MMSTIEREEGLRVAWCVKGGLGDALQAIPFIKRFKDEFSPATLAFYKDGERLDTVGRIVIGCIADQNGPYRESELEGDIAAGMYDLRIDIRRLPQYTILRPDKIKASNKTLWNLIETAQKRFEPLQFVFDHHAFYDGLFGRLMADYGMNVVEANLYYGGFGDSRHGKPALAISPETRQRVQRFGLKPGSYITVHDGFDVFNALAGTGKRPTRAWPRPYWEALIERLRAARPDLQIVQLGAAESSELLYGIDHYLLGATSLEEAIGLIDGAALHIDTEGGFVPCAWALETPAISIQGPTGSRFYHYDGITQLYDSHCHGCWWSTPDWMAQCPRGLERAECMHKVTPEMVLGKALDILSGASSSGSGAPSLMPRLWGDTIWGVNKNLPPLDIAAGQLFSVYWRGRRAAQERSADPSAQFAMPTSSNDPKPARSLLTREQFLHLKAMDEDEFVASAYRVILGREPDQSGFEHYKSSLLAGKVTKVDILKIFLTSNEAARRITPPTEDQTNEAFADAAVQLAASYKAKAAAYSGLLQNKRHGHDLFIKALALDRNRNAALTFERALQNAMPATPARSAGREAVPAAPDGLRVAVFMVGSFGDMLQQVPFINRFDEQFRPAALDLYFYPGKQVPGKFALDCIANANGPFSSEELEEHCRSGKYDLRIDMKHLVKYHVLNAERIRASAPGLADVIAKSEQRLSPYQFMLDEHPVFDGLFGRLMAKYGMNAVEATSFLGGLPLSRSDRPRIPVDPATSGEILDRFQLESGQYIVLHDGFDVDHYMVGAARRPTKNWPIPHWERLVQLIKTARPDLPIVQIGHTASSSPLRGIDVDLIGKTSLPDVVTVLKHAQLLVTSEGGILRMAWALDVPTVSLQGPSGSEFFRFGNTNTVISDVCNGCWFVLDEWMARCYRGYSGPACMNGIRPEMIMGEIHSMLASGARR